MADKICLNYTFLGKNEYIRIFSVADYEYSMRFEKFKLAYKILKIFNFLRKNWYIKVFKVADYESVVRFKKL